jgi:uncharacterized membrane protein YjfL (UPF0719 family)
MDYLRFAVGVVFWIPWYWQLLIVNRIGAPVGARLLLAVTPPVCGILLWEVLIKLADVDVRQDSRYQFFYLALGSFWVAVVIRSTSYLGLSWRDDVLERRNPAATYAITGALVGFTLAFAGGNVGSGPGELAVILSSLLSTVGLLLVWAALERLTRISELITVDRDPAAGVRLAGFLVAEGLVLGRAVAGDWISTQVTLRDFGLYSVSAVVLLALGYVLNRFCEPAPGQSASPLLLCGVMPFLFLVGSGALAVVVAGAPQ